MKLEINTSEIDGKLKVNVTCDNGHMFSFYMLTNESLVSGVENAINDNSDLMRITTRRSVDFLAKSRAALAELYLTLIKKSE